MLNELNMKYKEEQTNNNKKRDKKTYKNRNKAVFNS